MPRISELDMLRWPKAVRKIPVGYISYSSEEYGRIQAGFLSGSMDDQWALIWEDHRLVICRSRTGAVLFDCRFAVDGSRTLLQDILVSDDSADARHELEDVGAAWFLIGWRLLGNPTWADLDNCRKTSPPEGYDSLFWDWAELLRQKILPAAGPLPPLPATLEQFAAYFLDQQTKHPESIGITGRLAHLYANLGRLAEAEAALSKVVQAWGTYYALMDRAWLRVALGRSRDGAGDLEQALAMSSEHDELNSFLDALRVRLRRDEKLRVLIGSLDDLKETISSAPLQASGPLARGILSLAAQDWDGAIEEFSGLLAKDARDVAALKYRAFAYLAKSDMDAAHKDADLAINIVPIESLALYVRGESRLCRGDLAGATKDLVDAGKFQVFPYGLLRLGKILIEKGRVAEAKEYLESARNMQSDLSAEIDALLRQSPKEGSR